MIFYDFEVFKYDWLVVLKNTDDRSTTVIVNDKDKLTDFYNNYKEEIWCGYNSRSYDQYILKGILAGFNPKDINDWIIVKHQPAWKFSSLLFKIPLFNYDVMTSMHGLKQLEGFMGNDIRETTIPFDIDRKLTTKELDEVIFYCNHDVEQTMEVFINRIEEFEAHMGLIKTFKLPLKYINKTKAQLSSIILGAVKKDHDDEFNISIVDTIRLKKYKWVLEWYLNPLNKDYKKSLKVDIEGVIHVFSWGGLHGARSNYISEGIFVNSDVGSFYPSEGIEYNFLSRNITNKSKYEEIYDYRMKLKHEGKKKEQQPYKIVLNATYGASKDKYNNLYDPLQANNICVNGQLMLLDLIEKVFEVLPGALLIQSNTDGVMFKLECKDDLNIYKKVCNEWCNRTRMTLEHDIIEKVIQKDVNNYYVVKEGGKVKSKGAYAKSLNKLDYDLPIVNEALYNYFIKDIPVKTTINECKELIKFQKVVKVSGKYLCAYHGNKRLDEKVLRVFASKNNDPGVFKVKSEGATKEKIAGTPINCFINNADIKGKRIPRRLDKGWYIEVAQKRINDFLGVK
ncbi:hypothetical protein [Clostridium sardiniense]|uniref:hypothetical protein n=1 Tax=Clostridium sardiniense TaxID=29369 RepID=UPI00195C97CF|nr:hypothetical protein [Clostridium sardiniense]MBM7836426.1 hypothetical protein [Clostridium sardiniense]